MLIIDCVSTGPFKAGDKVINISNDSPVCNKIGRVVDFVDGYYIVAFENYEKFTYKIPGKEDYIDNYCWCKEQELKYFKLECLLSVQELNILESLPEYLRYITRNEDGSLCLWEFKPYKNNFYKGWLNHAVDSSKNMLKNIFNDLFDFVKWEDEEPFDFREYLAGIVKECSGEF